LICLPATAQASTVELQSDGTLTVRAAAGESNNNQLGRSSLCAPSLRGIAGRCERP
jgi:hypothetical protein